MGVSASECVTFFVQAEDGIRGPLWSRGLGEVYKRPGRGGDASTEKTPTRELRDLLEKEKPAKGEIKAKLAAYRADRKAREAKLKKAQEDLRQLLTIKQEAQAVLAGLLN